MEITDIIAIVIAEAFNTGNMVQWFQWLLVLKQQFVQSDVPIIKKQNRYSSKDEQNSKNSRDYFLIT